MSSTLEEWFDSRMWSMEEDAEDGVHDEEQDTAADPAWHFMSSAEIGDFNLTNESVAGSLLATAVVEIREVCRQARKILKKNSNELITSSDVSNHFLGSIAPTLLEAMGEGQDIGSQVYGTHLVHYIRVQAALRVFRATPTRFFDQRNKDVYPISQIFDMANFSSVQKALKRKRTERVMNNMFWEEPFCQDKLVRQAERALSIASSAIALVKNISVLSIDDDQYRLVSALSEDMGFTRINNPKKAFGPVSTGCVSVVTSIQLGLRLLGRGETYRDVVQVLLKNMWNVDLQSQVYGTNRVALDRGYQSDEIITYLIAQGFELNGTHKRVKGYPFTFGTVAPTGGRRLIQEVGAKGLYVAKKKFGSRWLYAIAYRGGRTGVATLFTTAPHFNTWLYVPKRGSYFDGCQKSPPLIVTTLDMETEAMTDAQGGCEWHILRATGIITSTTAFAALQYASTTSDAQRSVLESIGIISVVNPEELPSRMELLTKSISVIKSLMRQRGVRPLTGSLEVLVDRLINCGLAEPQIFAEMIKKLIMKPINNSWMKIGSANEAMVLQAIDPYLKVHSRFVSLSGGPIERGLLRRRNELATSWLGTSIDGACVLTFDTIDPETGEVVFQRERPCVIEIKTATKVAADSSNVTSVKEAEKRVVLAQSISGEPGQTVFIVAFRDELFKVLVWKPSYRCQLMHHSATTGVPLALFVMAQPSKIVYIVIVEFHAIDLNEYRDLITTFGDTHLQFFRQSVHDIPPLQRDQYGHATDEDTIQTLRKLAEAISKRRRKAIKTLAAASKALIEARGSNTTGISIDLGQEMSSNENGDAMTISNIQESSDDSSALLSDTDIALLEVKYSTISKVTESIRLPAHDIRPIDVDFWNHDKTGQDTNSRILQNVCVDFRSLTPRGFFYNRFIATALLNSHLTLRLLRIEKRLDSFSSFKQLKQSLNDDCSFWEFLKDFMMHWTPSASFISHPSDAAAILKNGSTCRPCNQAVEADGNAGADPPLWKVIDYLNGPIGRAIRLNHARKHQIGKAGSPRTCPLCSARTSSWCKDCKVPICSSIAAGRLITCEEKLHSARKLTKFPRLTMRGHKGRHGHTPPPKMS